MGSMTQHDRPSPKRAIIAGICLALVASACGSGSTSTSPAAPAPAPAPAPGAGQEAPSAPAAPAQPVVVTQWDYTAAALPAEGMVNGTTWWTEQIRERTGGALDITMHFNGSLVPAFEQLDAVKSGLTESSLITDLFFPAAIPLTSVIGIPFETEDPYAATMAFYELYQTSDIYRAEISKHGLVALHWVPWSSTVLASTTDIPTLASLEGSRLRAFGAVGRALTLAGVDTVSLGPAEVYDGINRGLVTGWGGIPFDSIKDFSIYEVAKYIVDVRYGHYGTSFIGISQTEWDKLPEDVRQVVLEVSAELQREIAIDELMKWEDAACETYKEAGVTIRSWSDRQRQSFIDLVGTTGVDTWVASVVANSDITEEQARAFRDEYLALYEKHTADSPYVPIAKRC